VCICVKKCASVKSCDIGQYCPGYDVIGNAQGNFTCPDGFTTKYTNSIQLSDWYYHSLLLVFLLVITSLCMMMRMFDGLYCSICPINTYDDPPNGCTPCLPGQCVCAAGQYEVGATGSGICDWCGLGTYSEDGVGTCTPCPPGNVGAQIGLTTSSCSYYCPEKHYCPFVGTTPDNTSAIIPCAPYASSSEGSTAQEECYCDTIGRDGNGWEVCDVCGDGKYGKDIGRTFPMYDCVDCDYLALQTSSAALEYQSCACRPGYASTPTGSLPCTACAKGTYKNRTADELCDACPLTHQTTSSTGSISYTNCYCIDGWYSNDISSPCQLCHQGYYCTLGTTMSCPMNATSNEGATALTACYCPLGFAGDSTLGCTACVPGMSCQHLFILIHCTNQSLADLLLFVSVTVGHMSVCLCIVCAGKYNDQLAATVCTNCPQVGQTSRWSANSSADCYTPAVTSNCQRGESGINGVCTECTTGRYKNTTGDGLCLLCDPGTYAALNGSHLCQLCLAGSYCDQTGMYQPFTNGYHSDEITNYGHSHV
jgi:hypothetical protein